MLSTNNEKDVKEIVDRLKQIITINKKLDELNTYYAKTIKSAHWIIKQQQHIIRELKGR